MIVSTDPLEPAAVAEHRRTGHVGGHDVAYRERGSGPHGVVLVHGIGVSSRYFTPLARELAGAGRVLMPDLPGFGLSPRPQAPLSIAEHARVLGALVAASGLDRPVLVGHSMGTQVVTELAAQQPGLVDRLVLIGAVIEPAARSAARQAWRLVRDARHETFAANRLMVADWLRCGPRWYGATLPTMLEYPLVERLAEVQEPVVLVRGSRDPVTPAGFLHVLAGAARTATISEVPHEGHIAMYRSPGAVAALCRRVPC
ncbi:alpha/beta fold hydrolase [Actinotalea sp. K2]|uniref:alpha/beta fold hydrolase n=1 Tax=Actinotalea sp. K2 TaxID=2939438 RepID=UPI0020180D76|nr:alpha/beta hydrolase [Actinotalea sp. K2]MCL3862924.1 alpha/beta hydrolase [Actinotalea sp. K2]